MRHWNGFKIALQIGLSVGKTDLLIWNPRKHKLFGCACDDVVGQRREPAFNDALVSCAKRQP